MFNSARNYSFTWKTRFSCVIKSINSTFLILWNNAFYTGSANQRCGLMYLYNIQIYGQSIFTYLNVFIILSNTRFAFDNAVFTFIKKRQVQQSLNLKFFWQLCFLTFYLLHLIYPSWNLINNKSECFYKRTSSTKRKL